MFAAFKMLLIGIVCGALLLTSACVKSSQNNPFREGYMYNGYQPYTSTGDENIRVLSTGELHFR